MNNSRSYARLTFNTSTGNTIVIDDANDCILSVVTCKEISNPNGTFSITLSPRIAKQLALSRGSLSISDVINPYDLVQIEFKVDDTGYHTEMIGLVSRAAVSLKLGENGAPQRVIKIDGFDMGAALKNFKIFFSPFVTSADLTEYAGEIYFGKDEKIFAGKNPAQFIRTFINLACGGAGSPGPGQVFYPLTFNNGLKIPNYIDFNSGLATEFTQHTILDPFFLTNIQANTEQSVYDIVKAYSDIPYHEVFMDLRRPGVDATGKNWSVEEAEKTHKLNPLSVDTRGNVINVDIQEVTNQQPYVFNMRTTPFSQGSTGWDALNHHDFLTSDVLAQDVATSEQNIYNYYDVVCERQSFALGDLQLAYVSEGGQSTNAAGEKISRFPIQDQDSINKYGIKRFPYHTTKFVEFVASVNTVQKQGQKVYSNLLPIQQIRTLARQLFRWFSFGEMFETGTIILRGRVGVGPKGITMGSRLREAAPGGGLTGKEYYIESVMQEFMLGATLRTTAAVTRGHFPYDWTDQSGATHAGRFTEVKIAEDQYNLTQADNANFFNPIDDEDY